MIKMLPLVTLAFVSACSYHLPADGGDATDGFLIEDGPAEVENPPEWVCRERAPKLILPGYDDFIQDLERCYYTPHAPPGEWTWPGKPHWAFVANVMHWVDDDGEQVDQAAEAHPTYMWQQGDFFDWGLHHDSLAFPHLPKDLEGFRSGLVGNFGLWLGGVPDAGHRPPIVMASFIDVTNPDIPTIVGHPFYEGRYNAYGVPCSKTRKADSYVSLGWPELILDHGGSENVDCQAWVEYYDVEPAHVLYPLYNNGAGAMGAAIDQAECQANGSYKVSEAAATSDERNGLIWVNWGEFWEDFVQWLQVEHPEVHGLIVAMDVLMQAGWGSWPVDPPYPYNNWSVTGECAHPIRLRPNAGSTQIMTMVPCPVGMVAVLPDFDPAVYLDPEIEHDVSIHGYCTFPHQTPPPGLADTTPIGGILSGHLGQGFTGAKYIDFSQVTPAHLGDWSRAVDITPTAEGFRLDALDALGRDLLEAFDVPDGSTVVGLNRLTLSSSSGEPGPDVLEVALEIDRAVANGGFIWALIDAPDGRRLHRYIVPHGGTPELDG